MAVADRVIGIHKGIKLKLACDNVGLGVSTYYKLRHRLKNGDIK